MKLLLLAVGKKHDPKLEAAILDYSKRLNHYTSASWELVEAKTTASMTTDQVKTAESNAIKSKINESDFVVLLDERGSEIDSPTLANRIQKLMNSGLQRVVFIIGGAYGVDDALMQRADFIMSLSRLVFPHQLVRLILIEQIYRAHTILAGEKYHHI